MGVSLLSLALLLLSWPALAVPALRTHTKLQVLARRGVHEPVAVITVATDSASEQVQQLLSSYRSRYNITVLGSGVEWRGMLTKMTVVMQHLHKLPPGQLVLFLDQDVRCFPCTRNLVDLFNEEPRPKIVFATDPDCYPDTFKGDLYPPSTSTAPEAYKFLNSGLYLGRARDILYLLAQHLLQQGKLKDDPKFSDQRMFGDIFLAGLYSPGNAPSIELDYAGRYFQVFDTRQTGCWKQDVHSKQVRCDRMFVEEACMLHTAGQKDFFYQKLVPRWLANETDLY